jgi:hypothetical protein
MITATIALCGSSVPSVKPIPVSPWCSRFEFSHKCARLFEPSMQLADRGARGRHHARRQARGEHVRPADQPHDLELRVVRDAEPADRADRLRERADDEVDLVDHPLQLGHAAAVLADEAHRVRLVDQHHRAVRLATATISLSGATSPSIE